MFLFVEEKSYLCTRFEDTGYHEQMVRLYATRYGAKGYS